MQHLGSDVLHGQFTASQASPNPIKTSALAPLDRTEETSGLKS